MQVILNEQASLAKFRRALRAEDQSAFDDLFRMAHYHAAESAYASHVLPFEVMLLAMLLEEVRETLPEGLRQRIVFPFLRQGRIIWKHVEHTDDEELMCALTESQVRDLWARGVE